jgi:hypothetical protein
MNLLIQDGQLLNQVNTVSEPWVRKVEGRPVNRDSKKAPDDAGALSLLEIEEKSVAGGHRCPVTTEFVIKAQSDHINVLADSVGRTGKQRIHDRE